MSAIEINSNIYDVYSDVAEADVYFAGAIHAANWHSASEVTKEQALITATRMFDRQRWLGEPSVISGQPLAWPRTGTGIDGVSDDVIPQDIIDGNMELALSLIDGSSVQTDATPSAQKIESLKAGSVSLTYFRGAEGLAADNRFPLPVMEYVGRYLAGNTPAVTGVATGTGGESVTGDNFGFPQGV